MKVFTFNISNFKSDGGAMMGVVPKVIWSNYFEADENNLVTFALRSLVVQSNDRVILIDNGIGTKQKDTFLQHLYIHEGEGLIEGLVARNITPEKVTDMVLTHLHFDHCGGGIFRDSLGQLSPTFPNARYWVSKEQWNNALHPNQREADAYLEENLVPMEEHGILEIIETETTICPGVHLRMAHGHTPGQLIPVVETPGQTYVFGADLIPTHLHIPEKYNMAYDLDVIQTMEEKKILLKEIVENDYILILQHDAVYEACTVKLTPKGYRMAKAVMIN